MNAQERAKICTDILEKEYPNAECQLVASNPLQLLIATRLSAQCRDERVNSVTPALFERFKTVDDFAGADVAEVEKYIHTCGLFKTKAEDIVTMCRQLRDDFDGAVPQTMEELTSLRGVGRKTANLILGDVYGQPAVVTDTHVIRISNLIGLCDTRDPYKVELKLRSLIDPDKSNAFCHRVVLHGRSVCIANAPKCDACVLNSVCKHAGSD